MIQLDIVTPEKKVFSDKVQDVYIPSILGEMGVLETHTALVTPIEPGELRYKKDGQEFEFAVGEGFVEVTQEAVTLLTDLAAAAADIDESIVEEAKKRAEDALNDIDPVTNSDDVTIQKAIIAKSVAQLKLLRKKK